MSLPLNELRRDFWLLLKKRRKEGEGKKGVTMGRKEERAGKNGEEDRRVSKRQENVKGILSWFTSLV